MNKVIREIERDIAAGFNGIGATHVLYLIRLIRLQQGIIAVLALFILALLWR